MSGLIWIQTVCHSERILERVVRLVCPLFLISLTFCLLVTSADNLCNCLDLDQARHLGGPDPDPKPFDTLKVFLKQTTKSMKIT